MPSSNDKRRQHQQLRSQQQHQQQRSQELQRQQQSQEQEEAVAEGRRWEALKADLDRNKSVYAALLGGEKKAPDSLVERFRMQCYQAVWHKPDLIWAQRDSLLLAFAEAAVVGLSINPTAKEGYIEIRGKVARFATQYQGLVKLMHRGTEVDFLFADVVRQGDAYCQIGGSNPEIQHKAAELGHEPEHYDEDESILATYAVIKTRGSSRAVHEVARRSEILKAMAMSKGKGGQPPSPAWAAWFPRMAKKLPLRRLANIVPGADEARMALGVEDAQAQGKAVTFDRVAQVFDPVASPGLRSPQQPDELAAIMNASGPAAEPEPEQLGQE